MSLPRLYRRWLDDALPGPVSGEPASTCDRCVMCPKHPTDPQPHFRPDVKCCGFVPTLPNFLVGAILRDGTPDGARTVRARLDRRATVSPLGVAIGPFQAERYRATDFGSDPSLVCPHFGADGGCTIWAHRNAACATWFCRVERGQIGDRFWFHTRALLDHVEATLPAIVASEVGAVPPAGWGRWAPGDEAYFVACADRVDAMAWDDVRAATGADPEPVVVAWAERAAPRLPERVRVTDAVPIFLASGLARFQPWSYIDAIDVEPRVLARLRQIDGMTPDDVVGSGPIDRALLQRLVDHGVVEAADDEA